MAFKTDFSKASEGNELKPEGYYEVIIESWKYKTFDNGTKKLNFTYVVRNDVEQKYKNALIFHSLSKKNNPNSDDESTGGYSYKLVMAIGEAAGLSNGSDYKSFEDYLNMLVNKPVKILLEHNPYNGKKYERVVKHYPTAFPQVNHKFKTKPNTADFAAAPTQQFANTAPANNTVEEDDDYPF